MIPVRSKTPDSSAILVATMEGDIGIVVAVMVVVVMVVAEDAVAAVVDMVVVAMMMEMTVADMMITSPPMMPMTTIAITFIFSMYLHASPSLMSGAVLLFPEVMIGGVFTMMYWMWKLILKCNWCLLVWPFILNLELLPIILLSLAHLMLGLLILIWCWWS